MKKQLIAIGLLSFLAVPSVVFAEEDACAPLMSEGMTEEAVMAAKSAAMNSSECTGQRLGSMEEFTHGHGVSLYGSFRTGITISDGETDVGDLGSNWGFQGSAEVAEGLTASFRYEGALDTGNAETSGGVGHEHLKGPDTPAGADTPAMALVPAGEAIAAIKALYSQEFYTGTTPYMPVDEMNNPLKEYDEDGNVKLDEDGNEVLAANYELTVYDANNHTLHVDAEGDVMTHEYGGATFATQVWAADDDSTAGVDETGTPQFYFRVNNRLTRPGVPEMPGSPEIPATELIPGTPAITGDAALGDSGPGGRLSYVDLSGGFGSIRMGQIWSASANHYYFKIDPSHVNGKGGGSSYRNANSISYSSSAGDVSFQIDKVTGDNEKIEFGATAALGPIGLGLGYWDNANDDASFTGFAVSAGAAGVSLTLGLGSVDDADGNNSDISIINIGGAVGDSGITYGIQIVNDDNDAGDQNLIAMTSSLGSGASLVFEFADPGGDAESSSIVGVRVDF